MSDNAGGSGTPYQQAATSAAFDINRNMTDSQFRQTLTQISTAAHAAYASPAPHTKAYMKNLQQWSTTTTPPPKNPAQPTRSSRARTGRPSTLAPTPTTPMPPVYQPPPPIIPAIPAVPPNPPRPPLSTAPQALQSTYASRLKTGATLLVQPILASTSALTSRTATRRGGVINYADPGSGDDIPDAGALDTDDSDFQASGGTRTSIRQTRGSRMGAGINVFNASTGAASSPRPGGTPRPERAELDQSYLGMVPPAKFLKPRVMFPTPHEYLSPDVLERHATTRTSLVPIRVEFETDTHRIRDCFVWNANERLVTPEGFARIFCNDLDIPQSWADTVATQIRAQLEDHEGVATMELGQDGALDAADLPPGGDELPECRVILSIDVQIANHHLVDHIEWDLLSPLTPEAFSITLAAELGLAGEAVPLIAHAVHEELLKHKKDAIEWGVIGGEQRERDAGEDPTAATAEKRDRSGFGLVKDKTGLGLGWGRAPRDGRGPKTLKSVWRDWAEAEEFRTTFEELTAEEVERREIERERATRRLRRETSKFQSSTRSRRR